MPDGRTSPDDSPQNLDRLEASPFKMESAKRNMALMPGLAGTCIAIFNFSLFFLYPRFVSGDANQIFFRLAVGDIVVSLFFFIYAATFYYLYVEGFPKDAKRATVFYVWADRCAVVAIALFVMSPALVLFAINLPDLASVALGLWLVHIGSCTLLPGHGAERSRTDTRLPVLLPCALPVRSRSIWRSAYAPFRSSI